MKILFLSHYFPPESNAPASRTHEMCRRWVAAGHAVHVITSAPNAPEGRLYEGYRNTLLSTEVVDGINVHRVWTFLAANSGFSWRLLNYLSYMCSSTILASFTDRPDVVVATSPQLFCGYAGWIASLILRAPFVLECRDLFAEGVANLTTFRKDSLLVRVIRKLEFFLYRRARHLVTVGPGYMRHLTAGGVSESRMTIITNGVDRHFFSPNTSGEATRQKLDIQGRFAVTYAGTIGMAHGLRIVLDAAETLKQDGRRDVVFILAGDGAERRTLEKEATERCLRNVLFTGRIPKAAMPELLAASDCCLIHLKKTALFSTVLPSKMFEMAYMAKPLILGVAGDAAEIIEAAQCGICITPEDASQLIAAIEALKDNPVQAKAMGRNGRTYMARHYDRDRLASKYLDVLWSVVRAPNPSRSLADGRQARSPSLVAASDLSTSRTKTE